MAAIAIVEDNPDVLEDVTFNLRRQGFHVTGFSEGAGLDAAMDAGHTWSVLVLDLGLPGEDGLSIARRLRQSHPAMGIVALTARGRLQDRIAGLDEGIDHYLVKPCDMDELGAAIRAVARRVGQITDVHPQWRLDAVTQELTRPDGEKLSLTMPEALLLAALAKGGARPLARDALAHAIGKQPGTYDMRALEVMISRLRSKLGKPGPLKAVRGQGYQFTSKIVVTGAPSVVWVTSGRKGKG